ncbi:MAG: hypothetical protein ABI282_09985 [Candidatus Baltobacteraceae bacterium]
MKRLTVALILAAFLAACGGGGGSNPGLPPSGGALTPAVSLQQGVQTSGVIVALWGGGFTMNTGSPHGFMHIYINGATQISGPAPFVGENVNVAGVGSFTTWITATSISESGGGGGQPSPTPAPIATPGGFVATQGTISYVSGTRLTVNSGYPHGNIPVTLAPNVAIFGGTPALNSYVTLAGTGSLSSSVTAYVVSVWQSAPPTADFSGTVVAGTAYGFTVAVDSSHTAVPVVLTAASVIAGGILESGAAVKVTGPGSIAESVAGVQVVVTDPTPQPSPNQTPTPTPGPISQLHVLTAGYLGGYYGTHRIPWSAAAPYLTWASTGVTDANAISSVGIKTMFYTDPNHVQVGDPMYTSDESTFAHDCSGNRVTIDYNGTMQYVMDEESPTLAALYNSVATQQTAGAHFDALFNDNAEPVTGPPTYSAYPCGYTDAAWTNGMQAVSHAAPDPVIFNGLSDLNGHNPSVTTSMLSDSNVAGGNFEHCYVDTTSGKAAAWYWQATENTELLTAATHKLFECQERNADDGAASVDARQYAYASFLLTYDPATSVLWEEFSTPSGFTVFPETQLIALQPVNSTPTQVTSLQIGGGAYGREYKACYIAGTFAGPCAVAVNPDSQNTYPFPFPQYTHTLLLSGEGVLDGGRISTNGPAPASYLSPLGSAIVFP